MGITRDNVEDLRQVDVNTADILTKATSATTLAGYGITDAFDGAYSSLTGTPTTLSGYGITDALSDTDPSITGSITEEVAVLSGNTLEPDNGTVQTFTMSSDVTFSDGLASGQYLSLTLTNGGYTPTWPTITWIGGSEPTLSTSDKIVFWKEGTTLYGKHIGFVS